MFLSQYNKIFKVPHSFSLTQITEVSRGAFAMSDSETMWGRVVGGGGDLGASLS